MDFDSALEVFDNNFFDFIYVDGYAHTGDEGGKTLVDWITKLKSGGVLARDDYHDDWPLVKWAVNDLVEKLGVELHVLTRKEEGPYSLYPSWYIINKTNPSKNFKVNQELYKVAMSEKRQIHNETVGTKAKFMTFFGRILDLFGLKKSIIKLLDASGRFR